MRLSVCTITAEPGPRVTAALGPLRAVADEIVVAADARVGNEDLAHYAGVADRLLRIEFAHVERHLAWLAAQCRGEWILRLEGDEVVSPALLQRLPALLERRDRAQYHLARRWVAPGGDGWLAELPWWPQFDNRLVRNDGQLRFYGYPHAGAVAVAPAEYVEEPIYHLACALASEEERSWRALRAELLRPETPAPGGGAYAERLLLPERHAHRAPEPLHEADWGAIVAVLSAGGMASGPPPDVPVVGLDTSDALWTGRPFDEGAVRGVVQLLEDPVRVAAGEWRTLHVRVTNTGRESWHWDPELAPVMQLGARWAEGEAPVLTPLPHSVEPGQTTIAAVRLARRQTAGPAVLELGVVGGDGAFAGEPLALEVEVEEASALPPRLAPRGPGHDRAPERRRVRLRRRRLEMPRIIHRVWLGGRPLPDQYREWGESWRRHHRRWEMRLWTDDDLPPLRTAPRVRRARSLAELADVVRYEILVRHGGVYIDTDMECLRPLDDLLEGVHLCAGLEVPGRVCNAVIGSVPGHPAWGRALEAIQDTVGVAPYPQATATLFLSLVLERTPDATVFPERVFYPYRWDEPAVPADRLEDSWAVHHWAKSWVAREPGDANG